jgi:hypothetical protein
MGKIKYFTQKELKKLFRSIERQKDYPFVLRDLAMFNIGYLGHRKIDSTMVYFQFTTKQQDSFYKKIAESPQIV